MSPGSRKIGAVLRESLGHVLSFYRWILLCLALLYLGAGVYSVSPNEVGVLQRFGRVVDDKVQPGIHYALPWPVDRVQKVPVKIVNRIMVDDFFSSMDPDSAARLFFKMTGLASYCITGDNNLVNIRCVIQYTITQPSLYLFRVEKPETLLRSMACNAVLRSLAAMPVDQILTRGKYALSQDIKSRLQDRLDALDTGLTVSFVELSDIQPPDRVERYFSDVVKAKIDQEKMVNDSQSYRNEKIPAAQADAARLLQEARAYRAEVVLRAEGETERFLKILDRARRGGDSVRQMLYLDTLKAVSASVPRKHIVFPAADGEPPARLRVYRPSP